MRGVRNGRGGDLSLMSDCSRCRAGSWGITRSPSAEQSAGNRIATISSVVTMTFRLPGWTPLGVVMAGFRRKWDKTL